MKFAWLSSAVFLIHATSFAHGPTVTLLDCASRTDGVQKVSVVQEGDHTAQIIVNFVEGTGPHFSVTDIEEKNGRLFVKGLADSDGALMNIGTTYSEELKGYRGQLTYSTDETPHVVSLTCNGPLLDK